MNQRTLKPLASTAAAFILVHALLVTPEHVASQERAPLADFVRFDGTVEIVRTDGTLASVRVALKNWIVPDRYTTDAFPVSGLTIVEVRGGEVVVNAGSGRRELEEGNWLTVAAGQTLSLATDNDSASLQTLSVTSP